MTLIEVDRVLCVRNSDFILTIKIDNVIGVIYSGHILNLNFYFAERKLVKKWAICVKMLAEKAYYYSIC